MRIFYIKIELLTKKYFIKNERTNRCILSKEQNDSSQFCELSETTKKCKNMTKKRTTPPARNKSVKTSNTSNTSKKSNTIEKPSLNYSMRKS